MKPLICHDHSGDALFCGFTIQAPTTATHAMMYMPGGLHEITPSQDGKPVRVQVQVTAQSADALNQQLTAINARTRKRVFFDFDHADGKASFWPERFEWRQAPEPGVYAVGEWTASGRTAIEGKDYRGFSPVFFVDDVKARPARIVARPEARPNMGGLVNDPAFAGIKPFFAHDARESAGASSKPTNQAVSMNEQEIAALQAKNTELQKQIDALKAKDTTDALIAAELRAKEQELKAGAAALATVEAEKKTATLEAKNQALETADLERRKAHAKSFAAGMVARGAIAAKDEKSIAEVEKNVTDNAATFEPLYAKWASHPALGGRITPPVVNNGSSVQIVAMSGKDSLSAYASLVAKNAAIKDRTSPDKKKLADEAAAIFAADMKGKEDNWMGVRLEEALKAADVTSAAVGTLAGTLVLQRNLPLLTFQYPMIKSLFTDFSDAVGLWQQTEMTRIVITPAVTEYDATLDANGRPKGFVVVTPAQTVDVPITLSKHVGIPMIFGVQTLASTVRNLFGEQSAGAINALGGYFVNMATALMTPANFNAYKQITDAGGATTNGSTTLTMASTAGVYKGQAVSGTGIPTGTHIKSVTDGTHAEMTIAATADGTGLTITLGEGLVPTLYPTYVKALADFNMASLSEIGAAFDNNKVPMIDRAAMLNASYYARLANDPTFNTFFAATRSPDVINKGKLPELMGFDPQKAPFFPTSSNRVGFAYHKAAIALKSRLPQDFTQAVSAMVPGSVTTVTDPDTGISVLLVERVDLTGSYAESRIEAMLGVAVGDPRAGMVLTSA